MAEPARARASDIAFTDSVKAVQSRKGSRAAYEAAINAQDWQQEITPALAEFIARQRSVLLATVNASGWPYIQHRGGPPGFVRVIDAKTLAFVDYRGNRQYISQGNLSENERAFLFFIDYTTAERVKVWGRARVVEDGPDIIKQLMPDGYRARPEQVFIFNVDTWSANCSQHIPRRYEAEDHDAAIASRDQRIRELEAELASR